MLKQLQLAPPKWLVIFLVVAGVGIWLFAGHDQFLYDTPIARVEASKVVSSRKATDQFENVDRQETQKLTVRLLNGQYKGQTLEISNSYLRSLGLDQRYRVDQELFLTQLRKHNGKLTALTNGHKRDRLILTFAWIVFSLLLLTLGKAGGMATASVALNTVLFVIAIKVDLRFPDWSVLGIFAVLAVLFATCSLLLALGPSKKMLATLLATLAATTLATALGYLVLQLTNEKDVYYESMQYVTQVPRPLFLAEILLGSLGAVMDEATDIVATLFELKTLNPQVTRRELFAAGKNVGRSIMGPLVNVLLLIFLADTFNSALLYLKNGNSLAYTFNMNMSLGMVQSLISGIGIVLTVPLVSLFGALLLGRGRQRVHD